MMKFLFSKKGFALTEILVAIALLAIVIAAFSVLFTNSFAGIFSAGRESEAQYAAQEAMENAIQEAVSGTLGEGSYDVGSNITVTPEKNLQFTATFPGEDGEEVSTDILGTKIYVEYDDGEQTVTLTSFVPDQ